MNPRIVPPLPAGCPWSGWALPDMKHCEANLCSWITAPANTWSNLAYIAVGWWILKESKRQGSLSARGLGWVSIAVGVTSFVFHATYTFAGQFFDYLGMFLLLGWALSRALLRAGTVDVNGATKSWIGLVIGSSAALLAFRFAGWGIQTIILIQTLVLAGLEIRLMVSKRDAPEYGSFWLMQGFLAAAYASWHLDHTDFACRPENHFFQLHAFWHVLTSCAFLAAWRFHEGVDELRARMTA